VLVDTSVWVDHLRRGNAALERRLHGGEVWVHPFVIGELACGHLRRRAEILSLLAALPRAPVVQHSEALEFLESQALIGRGLGWIDVHLLASAQLARIDVWTLDRRLQAAARALDLLPDIG
jgi:predicted nucleic acid-binding protein